MAAALLRVLPKGKISTLAVLPPRPLTVTKATAEAQGPAGHKRNFDFVATDVELGPDGYLYVTSLPLPRTADPGSAFDQTGDSRSRTKRNVRKPQPNVWAS